MKVSSTQMMQVNQAAADLPPSGIREIMTLAARHGKKIIRLDVGDPDFPTPNHVIEAAHTAAISGRTHYTPSAGIPELRAALARKVRERNGYNVEPQQIIVTQGASQGIFAALLAVAQPGNAVLLPDPAWPNYLMMSRLLQFHPVRYALKVNSGLMPCAEQLKSLITPSTRVLLLNSPSNPTGAIIDRAQMVELLGVASDYNLWVISDECYDEIVYDDSFISAAVLAPERVISAYSFSKTYAMTGWRIGYLTAPQRIADILLKCQESLLSCVGEPAQWAALSALTGSQHRVSEMRDAYQRRRDILLSAFNNTPVSPVVPRGAFYAWVDITATGMSDRKFVAQLLERYRVSAAPGTAFGPAGAGFIRLSLTAPDTLVNEAAKRLVAFIESMTT